MVCCLSGTHYLVHLVAVYLAPKLEGGRGGEGGSSSGREDRFFFFPAAGLRIECRRNDFDTEGWGTRIKVEELSSLRNREKGI
jgi:hypothetical protein